MLYDKQRWDRELEVPIIAPVVPVKKKIRTWRQLLLAAADLIEKKGWTKGDYQSHGRYCIMGAINKVALGKPSTADWKVRIVASARIHLASRMMGCGSIEVWNDSVAKSKAEVLRILRETASGK